MMQILATSGNHGNLAMPCWGLRVFCSRNGVFPSRGVIFPGLFFFVPVVFFCSGRCFWCPGIWFFCPWNRFECYWNRFFGSPWYFRCPEGFFLCPTEMKCPRVFLVPVSFGNIDFVAWFNEIVARSETEIRSKGTEGVESRNNCSNACPRLTSLNRQRIRLNITFQRN